MKIQCAVCNKDEASVYCSADDAALCSGCDHRVHHANKLAGKHSRFSLIQPSPKDSPLCDICQEKRAFLFCQQDRAILCKDCDVPIHKVNEHTQKHNRFLLTGVKLSATSSLYSPPSPTANSTDSAADLVPDHHRQTKPAGPITKSQKPQKSPLAAAATPPPPPPPPAAAIFNSNSSNQTPPVNKTSNSNTNSSSGKTGINNQAVNGSGHGSTTSSISEYLIETLPGWHVEDFLDSSPLFLKGGDMDVMPFWDGDLLVEGNMNTWSRETMGMWVPQAPPPSLPPAPPPPPSSNYMGGSYGGGGGGGQLGPKELLVFGTKHNNNNMKSSRKWRPDDGNCFTVPQISPPSSTASKRSRTFWH